jgi:antitoxin (DNA-binding transcriptional repressor) of toxin-antitoxin stability system
MRKMSIREARTILGRVDELVGKEGEIVLTNRGRPLARVLPMPRSGGFPDHSALRRKMKPLKVGSEVIIRQMRDED